jgi:predicted amidohydrolase YtcJ
VRAAVLDDRGGLSAFEALTAYTAGGAYAAFQEAERGSLAPGMLADLQVYERDPLAREVEAWQGLRPAAVAVAGALVHGRW